MVEQGGFTLYYNIASQPSRSLLALCAMFNIKHTEVSLNLMKGEHKTEDFLKINPRG